MVLVDVTIYFKKISHGKLLIERIVELQIEGPGPPGLKLVISITKQKSLRKILEWIIINR